MKNTSVYDSIHGAIRAFALRLLPVLLCAAVCYPVPADAAGYLYSGKRKTVNCGILQLDGISTKGTWDQPLGLGSAGGVGDLFYQLDSYTQMKPAGWSLDNPYAPVDSTGIKYKKTSPEFWRINLASARNLSKMHVLYLPAQGRVLLSDDDREKLRKFVDSGGVLWIDNVSATTSLDFRASNTDKAGTFFISDFYFEKVVTGGYDVALSRHHPILTLPYWIDDREIFAIGGNWGQSSCHPGYDIGSTAGWASAPLTTDVLFSIVAKGGGDNPSVVANAYGSGRVVATANFAGAGCYLAYPHNLPSLKLAYNVLAWSASWTDLRKNPRRSAAGIDTVGGTSLVKVWSAPNLPATGESGAVIYKNMTFYSSGNTVYAYDVNPSEDLDHDGNPDDGAQDVVNGYASEGQDLVWSYQCGNEDTISAPTVATFQNPYPKANEPSKGTVEAVVVMGSTGTVYMLNAFPMNGNTLQSATTTIGDPLKLWISDSLTPTSSDTNVDTPHPSPPICVNGWVYVVAGDGRLYARNPALEKYIEDNFTSTARCRWIVPGKDFIKDTKLKSGAMFGYVNASNSGAVVGMVYWCVSAAEMPDTQQEQNDFIYGVPVYVKNDRLRWRSTVKVGDETTAKYFTDYQTSFPDLRISKDPAAVVRTQYGNEDLTFPSLPNASLPLRDNGTGVGQPITRNGFLVVETDNPLPTDMIMYADYSLDYYTGMKSSTDPADYTPISPLPRVRAPLIPSSVRSADVDGNLTGGNEVPPSYITSMPAMGPDNVMYVSAQREPTTQRAGGSLYSIRNDGSSSQSTKWLYMLHSGVSTDMLQGVTTPTLPVPGLLRRQPRAGETVNDFLNGATIESPQVFGSPVVYGDKVFVTVSAGAGQGGALLCFKANSDFVVRIMQVSGIDKNGNPIKEPKRLDVQNTGGGLPIVKIWQPNMITGSSGLGTIEAIEVPANMLDRDKGTITFSNFNNPKLRGGPGNFQETSTFSPSLPFWVTVDGIELPIDWDSWGPTSSLCALVKSTMPKPQTDCVDLSSWNNLLWYYAPPKCTGIHSSPVLIGNCVYFTTDDGKLYAINAETGETTGGPVDPYDADAGDAGTWAADPRIVVWEEEIGDASEANVSISGCNGVLMVPTANGLQAYANPTTLVADSNRLVEVDSSGNVSWALDSVLLPVSVPKESSSGNVSLPRRTVPINKPSRAKFTETGEIMLVNTGSNMVCKTDKSGNIGIQQIETYTGGKGWFRMAYDQFTDPKQLLRPGQPLSITSPTDAIIWSESEEGPGGQKAVIHCIIADSGNSRVLDLVYRFNDAGRLMNQGQDQDSRYYLPELNWVSNTESKGERYVFECLQMVANPRSNTTPPEPYTYLIWAAISNYRVDSAARNPQGMGGAIVGLNYRTRAASATQWNYSASTFPGPVTAPGKIAAGCQQITLDGRKQPFACPRYFQVMDKSDGRHLLVCDNRGAYKIGPLGGDAPAVTEQLMDAQYRALDRDTGMTGAQNPGAPLHASSVQELPNGKWLIANSYSGTDLNNVNFSGEVFEFDLQKRSVVWSSPLLKPTYSMIAGQPSTDWKQTMGTSYKFQQPRSAFRQ